MRAAIATEADLLAPLYEGMFEQPLWHTFLTRLRARTGALFASLIFRPIGQNPIVELFAGDRPQLRMEQLLRDKYPRDPLSHREMREGRVYSLEELLDRADPIQQGFHDDVLLPMGLRSVRTMRVAEPSGIDAWLSCVSDRPLGAAVGALLSTLAPHVRIALRSYVALERARFRAAVTADAIQRMDFGWLTLDARCRIIETTPHAEQLFRRSGVLRRGRYDRLTPASPAIDRELSALVGTYAGDPEARPKAFNLSRDPWIDMLVTPAQQQSIMLGSTATAIVYLSGDRSSQADRCDQLVELFGLLPSEARLAWAIGQGLSIAEAAAELNLSVETARTYSKKIYAKVGARGQADLVRIVLTSVLALA